MRSELIPHWLLQIREMLHEEPSRRRSLIDLSRHVGRHPVQISRQFHHHFGCTMSEYIRRIRISRAQSLLSCPDLEISDVALASGFCDQSHFTAIFRRVTGMSPRRFRLLISGNRPLKPVYMTAQQW
jgi:AraC family transcriptional regulator